MTFEEIRHYYPQLIKEDIQAVLAYAAELMQQEVLIPLAA
jgi:uncharacterized protein (DUF433 family)